MEMIDTCNLFSFVVILLSLRNGENSEGHDHYTYTLLQTRELTSPEIAIHHSRLPKYLCWNKMTSFVRLSIILILSPLSLSPAVCPIRGVTSPEFPDALEEEVATSPSLLRPRSDISIWILAT
jgi:hypothetical protein